MGNWDCSFARLQKTENRKLRTEIREPRVENRESKIESRKSFFSSRFSVFYFRISVLSFLFSVLCSLSLQAQQSPFRLSTPLPPIVLQPGETKPVSVHVEIPPKHFVYRDKTNLKFINLEGLEVEAIQYPPSKKRQDIFFRKTLDVFQNSLPITVFLKAPAGISAGKRVAEGVLTFQGCSDVLCYPEESHLITVAVTVGLPQGAVSKGGASAETSVPSPSLWELVKTQDFSEVWKKGFWIVLAVVFLGGFLTSLTPCVLPVIPITLLIIGVRADRHWSHNFILSAVLVLGLALTYALLGMLAVGFGKSLGFIFHEKWFVILLAVLFFVLALSMFGLFDIHLPQFIRQKLNQVKGHGLWGAFISGAAAGLLAAPCAGPVVGALLLFVAGTRNFTQGFGLLFVYALGMGLLFLVLGTGYGTLEAHRRWKSAVWAKRFLGLLLLGGSLFYFNSVIPLKAPPSNGLWLSSEEAGLELAAKENKVLLIDFYAEWCPPCKELELGFFKKKEVVEMLERMVPVRVDATFMDNPEVRRVIKKYNVIGWPTIVFVGPDGEVLKDLTVVSYNPDLLLENMRKVVKTEN